MGLWKQGVVHPRENVLHPEAGVINLFQLRQWGEPVTINAIPILRSNQGGPHADLSDMVLIAFAIRREFSMRSSEPPVKGS